MKHDFSNYLSPFSWRYGSEAMRTIWSETHKYELWRKIWVALAEVQHTAGLISAQELADLQKQQSTIDIDRILEIETSTKHDVVAAVKEFAEKAKVGGGKIHLGATSMDVVDNADMLKICEALDLIEKKLQVLLKLFSEKIVQHKNLVCMGYTHLQPAEPTTVGYRLAFYAQDLLTDWELLQFVKSTIQAKGMKGAVGTAASYAEILKDTEMTPTQLDELVTQKLGITPAIITTQVYPRKYDYLVLMLLASIASSLAKFAGDVRLLQAPGIGEWAEPFGSKQVGSSAMPFKKNPINSEKICSLARLLAALPAVALENATHSYLERTLDDSANKRVVIAEAFLAADELLLTAEKIVKGLLINKQRIARNVALYSPFSATEVVLIALVKKGADRQQMHELLREISLQAWEAIQQSAENPMTDLLKKRPEIAKYLTRAELEKLFDVSHHVGDAPTRAMKLVTIIKKTLK